MHARNAAGVSGPGATPQSLPQNGIGCRDNGFLEAATQYEHGKSERIGAQVASAAVAADDDRGKKARTADQSLIYKGRKPMPNAGNCLALPRPFGRLRKVDRLVNGRTSLGFRIN